MTTAAVAAPVIFNDTPATEKYPDTLAKKVAADTSTDENRAAQSTTRELILAVLP